MGMTAREAQIVEDLARDAQGLKEQNGWYGDAKQGTTTVQEDRDAIQAIASLRAELHAKELVELQAELTSRAEHFMTLMRQMAQREGRLTMAVCKRATDFFGFCQDGDMDQVRKAHQEMREYVEERGKSC